MSEKSKEATDTSAFRKHPVKPNIVKNPLLSASVTNFDDLSNFPLLLPAAPPPQPAPAVIPPSKLEPKSLVTVGPSSDIDSESLDEINLNAAPIEDLGPPPIIDTNTNPLLDQSLANDSLLSQAASSFSALPSVASSVFSTFSKRIYAGSSREQTPSIDNNANPSVDANPNATQFEIQPSYLHQQNPIDPLVGAPNIPFYAPPPVESNLNTAPNNNKTEAPLPEPPKFYTLAEVPIVSASAPPTGCAQNTYRLPAKKKLYAPIPGLSDQSQPVAPLSLINTAPATYDSGAYTYQQEEPQQVYTTAAEPRQDERKAGLFSLTNLVPTGVLQNITGLVQTAAGTLGQSIRPEPSNPYTQPDPAYLQAPISVGINNQPQPEQHPQSVQPSIPLPTSYPAAYHQTNQNLSTNFFTPPPIGHISEPSPFQAHTQHHSLLSAPAPTPPQVAPVATITTDNPKEVPSQTSSVNFFSPKTGPTVPAVTQSNPTLNSIGPGVSPVPQFLPPTVSSGSGINYFNPSAQTQASEATQLPSHPNLSQPPPHSAGHTSFRLQKGTRLYKSPLTAAETAPLYASPQQPQQQHSTLLASQQQPTFFNPFATNSGTETAVPAPVPTQPVEIVPNNSVAQPTDNEAVQLFNLSKNPSAPVPTQPVEIVSNNSVAQSTDNGTVQLCNSSKDPPAEVKSPLEPFSQQPIQTQKLESQVEISNPPIHHNIQTVESPAQHEAIPKQEVASEVNLLRQIPSPTLPSSSSSSSSVFTTKPVEAYPEVFPALTSKSGEIDLTANLQQQPFNQTVSAFPPLPPSAVVSTPSSKQDICFSGTLTSAFANLSVSAQPSTTQTNTPLPPPPSSGVSGSVNPYRKGLSSSTAANTQSTLASFFTPAPNFEQGAGGDFISGIQSSTNSANLQLSTSQPPSSSYDTPYQPSGVAVASTNISSFFSAPPTEVQPTFVQDINVTTSTDLPSYSSPIASEVIESAKTNTAQTPITTPTSIPPPIGFDNTFTENTNRLTLDTTPKPTESEQRFGRAPSNAFSNFFGQPLGNFQQESNIKSQTQQNNFFDSFSATTRTPVNPVTLTGFAPGVEITDSTNSSEDQVLQNFFNNPPPKENSSGVGDLNYDLVHSGLGVRTTHTSSLTAASNVVEPPSSACSEFSELNNSSASQRILLSQSVGIAGEDTTPHSTPSKTIKEGKPDSVDEEEDLLKHHYSDLPAEVLKELRMANFLTNDKTAATSPPPAAVPYSPAVKHWFYKRPAGNKHIWTPFSHYDSALLETSFTSNDEKFNVVAVEGGRYDVNISERLKRPVYWEGEPIEVRRCSWFYKASDSKYVPYEEESAQYLEEEYKQAAESGVWHKKIVIGRNEQVVFHGPTVIVHFQQLPNADNWGGTTQTTSRPRVVKRDLDDFTIEQGESQRVDHLLLMVHGIGSACDLKMRSVEEVVDDFRSIAQQLVQSHYKNSTDMGIVGRVEVLPISWHSHLHSEEMGIDEKLKSITLESIPKLRSFTNDTLLDVLFYTSPTYCQKIITTVASAMNALYIRYRERHPEFSGGVSLAGHSLGSLILFDLLCHQQPIKECEEQNMENPNMPFQTSQLSMNNQSTASELHNVISRQISYTVGPAGTGQPFIQYAQLVFNPKKFFALGSPIGMFVTIRGIDKLGLDFRLPTCPGFYNIFHPFDPVAYRIEALVNPDMSGIRPVLIPHHKGRKRMHLELKETMTRVGADLKQRFLDTFRTTLDSVNFLGSTKSKKEAEENMEKEVDKVIAMQMEMETDHPEQDISQTSPEAPTTSARSRANSNSTTHSDDLVEIDFPLGKLNDSKRIDYVLQEAPLEFFNEYLFALSSHVCYWDSSDTILFVMKEIYSGLGISPDSQVPQQTMTIERPSSRNSVSQSILPPTN